MKALLDFWSKYEASPDSKFHPEDIEHLQTLNDQRDVEFVESKDLDDYITSGHSHRKGSKLHKHLPPSPFLGDPNTADIFFILMNPGFSDEAYFALSDTDFQARLTRNLNGNRGECHPFLYLDPHYCWTSGYQWWEQKLYRYGEAIEQDRAIRYREAMRLLSTRICAIESFPYASRTLPWNVEKRRQVFETLPSCIVARDAIAAAQRKAEEGKAIVIFKQNAGRLSKTSNHEKVLECKASQGFYVGPNSSVGVTLGDWIAEH